MRFQSSDILYNSVAPEAAEVIETLNCYCCVWYSDILSTTVSLELKDPLCIIQCLLLCVYIFHF